MAHSFNYSGSGITLYALLEYALSMATSIDGKTPTIQAFDGVSGCCTSLIQPAYNFSFFDVQQLPYGDHSLNITLMNVTSGNRASVVLPSQSYLRFDYAAVNQTNASSISPAASPTTAPVTASVTHHVPIAARIGAAAGGTVVLLAIIFVLLH